MKREMKYLLLFVFVIFNFISCNLFDFERKCKNNLNPIAKNLAYKGGEVVQFVNDSGYCIFDTIKVRITDPGTHNQYGTDSYYLACGAFIGIDYSKFHITIGQGDNSDKNGISYRVLYYPDQFMFANTTINDTIEYNYNGEILKTFKIVVSKFWKSNYCSEIVISIPDFRIIHYKIVEDSITTTWNLK